MYNKILFLSLLLIVSFGTIQAQTIRISIQHSMNDKVIFLNLPFGPDPACDTCKPLTFINEKSIIHLHEPEPRFVYLHCGNQIYKIFIQPRAMVHILLDNKYPDSICFKGQLANENHLINSYPYKTVSFKYVKQINETSFSPQQFLTDILSLKKKVMVSFEIAAKQQNCSQSFIELYRKELEYYYVDVFGSHMIDWFLSNRKDTIMKKRWIKSADKIFTAKSVFNDKALNSQTYKDYLQIFMHYQLWMKIDKKDTSLIEEMTGWSGEEIMASVKQFNSELPLMLRFTSWFFKGKTLEYYQAFLIKGGINRGDLKTVLYTVKNYKKEFPSSLYLKTLEAAINPIKKFYTTKEDNQAVKFITNNDTLKSINQLIKAYKGKVIYLDTWATWCGPCLDEMKYVPALHDRFDGKNILFLFFSIDDRQNEQHWQNLAKFLDLKGINIRSYNDPLYYSLLHKFGIGNKIMTIPRYAIIDKHGNWVNKNAPRPSAKGNLYRILDKYIQE